jgi:DNA-binding NtrC family response regulator
MRKVLYVDDELDNLFTLGVSLSKWFNIITLENPTQALETIGKEDIKVLVTDQRMPKLTGLELAKRVQEKFPLVIIIILTAYDDNETMLNALNQGGIFRYLLKPCDIQDLRQTLDSAFDAQELRTKNVSLLNDLIVKNKELQKTYCELNSLKEKLVEENVQLKDEINERLIATDIIGKSKVMTVVLRQLEQAAKSDSSILILGETGTGKELFANNIHSLSRRKHKVLVKINCAAIPETLIESELFGHEKGTFTGADKLKYGKLEIAHQGTLFLDEIGELPLNMQPKFLRVLQENEFERLGSHKTIKTDFRLVTATNRDLQHEVDKGTFRSDLFYRLNILPITIPPLRDHIDDVPLLVNHFVAKFNRKTGNIITTIPKKTLDLLMEYNWPGNIRELENVIERAHVLSSRNKLEIDSWFTLKKSKSPEHTEIISLEENEKEYIIKVLKQTKWKVRGNNGAAQLLKINPSTLESRMKKLGIERPI